MKQGNLSKWSDIPNCKNLLFFSQLVNELLFDYSIPSNRVSTLNSHYLCIDALNAINGIESHGVPEGTLKPIMEELYVALKKDSVFKFSSQNPLTYFVKYENGKYRISSKVSELNYEELKRIAYSIATRFFSDNLYYESLKTTIIQIIKGNNESEQQDLFRLVKSMLTELINFGYTQAYIFSVMNRVFWNSKLEIQSPEHINLFFESFSLQRKKYNVFFIVDKAKALTLVKFIKGLPIIESLEPRTTSKSERQFLNKKMMKFSLLLKKRRLTHFKQPKTKGKCSNTSFLSISFTIIISDTIWRQLSVEYTTKQIFSKLDVA